MSYNKAFTEAFLHILFNVMKCEKPNNHNNNVQGKVKIIKPGKEYEKLLPDRAKILSYTNYINVI